MTVPIAVLQWYRLQCYAWYRFSAIVNNLLYIVIYRVLVVNHPSKVRISKQITTIINPRVSLSRLDYPKSRQRKTKSNYPSIDKVLNVKEMVSAVRCDVLRLIVLFHVLYDPHKEQLIIFACYCKGKWSVKFHGHWFRHFI